MALRNALGDLALDATLVQVRDALAALTLALEAMGTEQRDTASLADPGHVLPYAKTLQDAMRVNVENASSTIAAVRGIAWGNGDAALASAYPGWYGQGSPNSLDAREAQRELSVQTFHQTRNSRWVIT